MDVVVACIGQGKMNLDSRLSQKRQKGEKIYAVEKSTHSSGESHGAQNSN